jgi:hypothetical protein
MRMEWVIRIEKKTREYRKKNREEKIEKNRK